MLTALCVHERAHKLPLDKATRCCAVTAAAHRGKAASAYMIGL